MTTRDQVPDSIDVAVALRRAQLRKQLACEAELARIGMTLPQWGMLYAVVSIPDSSTHALALFTGQSDQSAGAVVTRLAQRGLIERRSEGGRAILHRITPEGLELTRRCDEIVTGVMDRLLAGLSKQNLRALMESLATIAAAAAPEAGTRMASPISHDTRGRSAERP
jgi:DNA-binding MarR family transcriptional regulator